MSGLDRMKARVSYLGYDSADGRNVTGKYKSFQAALKNSYQAEWITLDKDLIDENGNSLARRYRCLINASRLTENFDKKVISIDFDSGIDEGTVFWWDRTNRYWIVDLQQHTEEAYFRGTITRCDYELEIDGKTYWASVRGPVETATIWNQKHGINWNDLNYSMVINVTKNSQTVNYFTRHQVIKMKLSYPDIDTGETIEEWHNWKVVATDKYSSESLIEVYLDEWYDNPMEDAAVQVEEEEQDPMQPHIDGPAIIHVFDSDVSYSIVGITSGTFVVNSKAVKINSVTDNSCVIDVLTGKATEFNLIFIASNGVKLERTIKIESF